MGLSSSTSSLKSEKRRKIERKIKIQLVTFVVFKGTFSIDKKMDFRSINKSIIIFGTICNF